MSLDNVVRDSRRERKYPRKDRNERECPKCKKGVIPQNTFCPLCGYRFSMKSDKPNRLTRGIGSIMLYVVSFLLPPVGLAIACYILVDDSKDPIGRTAVTISIISLGLAVLLRLIW